MPSRVIKEKGVYEFIYAAKEVKKVFQSGIFILQVQQITIKNHLFLKKNF